MKIKNYLSKHKKLFVIVSISLIVISLLGGSYAMFQRLDKAEYANNYKTGLLQIVFDDTSEGLGGVINVEGAVPTANSVGANLTPYRFKIINQGNLDYKFDLKLVIDADYTATHGCNDKQLSANYIMIKFNDEEPVVLSSLTDNVIKSNIELKAGEDVTYELRAWLKEGAPNEEIGKHYHGKLTTNGNAVYTKDTIPNAPVLADGMIPITYSDTLSTWVKANTKNTNFNWYDYSNKMWANAVMVTSDKRDTYMNAEVGTEVKEDDILAYYVWIPRYKYKLFNATYASGKESQLIEVTFENGTSTTGTVTCTYASNGAETCQNKVNGNWYTHPAFTMINASGNKTELKGIWVGKFETTGSTTTPTIKPGVSSLRSITVANMYNTGKLFRSTDYITSNGINQSDSHMMKNIEWGSVAYLKQSNYGLGITDIGINNNSSYYTGGGSGTSYKTNIGQSTTGNITVVYDMSGGADEYVMGNYKKTAGYSGLTISTVPTQHIDIYSGTSASASHLGDALGETAGWYSDFARFLNSSNPWFGRGGGCDFGDNAGVFYFGDGTGEAGNSDGFRVALSTTGA